MSVKQGEKTLLCFTKKNEDEDHILVEITSDLSPITRLCCPFLWFCMPQFTYGTFSFGAESQLQLA